MGCRRGAKVKMPVQECVRVTILEYLLVFLSYLTGKHTVPCHSETHGRNISTLCSSVLD